MAFAAPVAAQTHLQKFSIDKLSFQYRSVETPKLPRCLHWNPLDSDAAPTTLQYDQEGRPFLKVPITALQSSPNCAIRVVGEGLDEIPAGEGPGERRFIATVRPPVSVLKVEGPGFRDDLIFEAPLRSFTSSNFFEFFGRSKVYFESRYASFNTNNPDRPLDSPVVLLPVFGGNIALPVPAVSFLFVGFSMFQNLGSLIPNADVGLQYSEFAFDLRAIYRGSESWGAPTIGLMGEFRGRNVYQIGAQRSFVIAAAALPYAGFEASWFPFGAFLDWNHWLSRLGVEVAGHLALQRQLAGRPFRSDFYEGLLQYRLSSKWALGVGYSLIRQSADFSDAGFGSIEETAKNYFLRLSLLPRASESR
mgnify:CR=1 FL=1